MKKRIIGLLVGIVLISVIGICFVSADCDVANITLCSKTCQINSDCKLHYCYCSNENEVITNVNNISSTCDIGNCICLNNSCSAEEAAGGPIQYGECGDGVCDNGEDISSYLYYCPQDCVAAGGPVCGNGVCEGELEMTNCPQDCVCIEEGKTLDSSQDPDVKCCEGLQEKSQYDLRTCITLPSLKYTCVICGNGECGLGENKCNCPEDCEDKIYGNNESIGSEEEIVANNSNLLEGENAKILSDVASEKAQEGLRELGFNLFIRDVVISKESPTIYVVNGVTDVKLFGFIKKSASISIEVNVETGEVISIKKPWWSFLAGF